MNYRVFESELKTALSNVCCDVIRGGYKGVCGLAMYKVRIDVHKRHPVDVESGAVDYYLSFLEHIREYDSDLYKTFVESSDEIVINNIMKGNSAEEKKMASLELKKGIAAVQEGKKVELYPSVTEEMKEFFVDTVMVDKVTKVGDMSFHHDVEAKVDKESLFHDLYDFTNWWSDLDSSDTINRWRCLYNELETNNLVNGCKVVEDKNGKPRVEGRAKIKRFVETVMAYCLALDKNQQEKLSVLVGHAKTWQVSDTTDIEQFVRAEKGKIKPA